MGFAAVTATNVLPDAAGSPALPSGPPVRDSEQLWPGLPAAVAAGEVDRVEIKVMVAPGHHGPAMTALGLDPLDTQIRQVYFFDTPDLSLHSRGIVLRVRRIQRQNADAVIKLRQTSPILIAARRRCRRPDFTVEVDALPGTVTWSAALTHDLDGEAVLAAVAGQVGLLTLFSRRQRNILHSMAGDVDVDRLRIFGPVTVAKLYAPGLCPGVRVAVEIWHYPDGTRTMEVSAKCRPSRAVQVATELTRVLTVRDVWLADVQQSKTHRSLTHFTTGARC